MRTDRPPAMTLREQGREEVRRRINIAARSLLESRSFDELTTRDFAREAKIGEATLFRHITTKDDLLMLAFGDQMDQLLDDIEANDADVALSAAGDGGGFCDRVFAIYRERGRFYEQHPTNSTAYLRLAFVVGGSSARRSMTQGDRTIGLVTSIIAEGQEVGALSKIVDPAIVAQNCHGIYIHEIERAPVRGFSPATFWTRTRPRLEAQLMPLVLHLTSQLPTPKKEKSCRTE